MQGSGARDDAKRATVAATCTEDKSTQTTGKCNTCGVRIGDGEYCAKCSLTTDRLVDGVCTATDTESACTPKDSTDGTCKSCAKNYFLFQGGCYKVGKEPGSLVCTDALGSNTDKPGVCKACAESYFTVSSATATQDSCVACGDENCATCTEEITSQKCSKCKAAGERLYLKKESSGTGACITAEECTVAGFYFPDSASDPKECKACEATCATCAGAAASQCTSCKDTGIMYLKKDNPADSTGTCASVGTTDCRTCAKTDGVVTCASCEDRQKFGLNKRSCVAECPDNASEKSGVCTCNAGFTPNEDSSACTQCHSSCLTCSAADENSCTACAEGTPFLGAAGNGPGKCVSCGDASSSTWKGVANCAKCTSSGQSGTAATCTECAENYYLKTNGATSCVADCGEGFFATTVSGVKKVCMKCSDTDNGGIQYCAKCSLFPYK